MSPGLQAKLLQVLQDGEFTRLGGNREIHVDVRVVCATNRDLDQMVKQGAFRQDLFFRLNVVSVMLPPLRERREEIPRLAEFFGRRFAVRAHMGNLSLFLTGLCAERIAYRRDRRGAPGMDYYEGIGRASFHVASRLRPAGFRCS